MTMRFAAGPSPNATTAGYRVIRTQSVAAAIGSVRDRIPIC